jgi:CRP-like cAMP-binding protein
VDRIYIIVKGEVEIYKNLQKIENKEDEESIEN